MLVASGDEVLRFAQDDMTHLTLPALARVPSLSPRIAGGEGANSRRRSNPDCRQVLEPVLGLHVRLDLG
jgi:hypothetical protein